MANYPHPVTKCPPPQICAVIRGKLPPPSDKMAQPSKLRAILSLVGAFCLLDRLSKSKWRRRHKNSTAIEFLCRERRFASGFVSRRQRARTPSSTGILTCSVCLAGSLWFAEMCVQPTMTFAPDVTSFSSANSSACFRPNHEVNAAASSPSSVF